MLSTLTQFVCEKYKSFTYISLYLSDLYKKVLLFLFKKFDDDNEKSNTKIKSKKSAHLHAGLFNEPITYQNFSPNSTYIRQCAVSDFDYDFTSPNPFNWDFQDLVLNQNNIQNNNSQTHNAEKHTLKNINSINNNNLPYAQHSTLINNTHSNPNQLLENFNQTFQNSLRTNELYQIHESQSLYSSLNHNLSQFNRNNLTYNFNEENLSDYEVDDDDYINKLNQSKFGQINYQNQQHQYNNDENIEYDDEFDPLPLDDELMLSYLRTTNNDFKPSLPTHTSNLSTFDQTDDEYEEPMSQIPTTLENTSSNRISLTNPLKREYDNDSTPPQSNETKELSKDMANDIKAKKLKIQKDNNETIPIKQTTQNSPPPTRPSSASSNFEDDSTFSESSDKTPEKSQSNKSTDNQYICSICNATFKVKGYLTRHQKKHSKSKPFQCPYFDSSIEYTEGPNENDSCNDSCNDLSKIKIPRCHPTGGFSRRDTFKTHLKAIHFVYPTGTKSGDRHDKRGRCAACFKEFSSNKEWLENHVITNSCEKMITKYK